MLIQFYLTLILLASSLGKISDKLGRIIPSNFPTKFIYEVGH